MRRVVQYTALVLATIVLTTMFQPLSLLPALAGPSQQVGCQTFKETGKIVCGKFLQYWQQHGGLAQQGYPISDEFNEKSTINGQTYRVQYFERAVFELHPENQSPYDVLLSQLGTYWARQQYGNPPGFPGEGEPPPPPPPPTLGEGVSLRQGVTITLVAEFPGNAYYHSGLDICQAMNWAFAIENGSNITPYTINLDQNSPTMRDSTGKTYKLGGPCGGTFDGAFTGLRTLSPREKLPALIRFDAREIPQIATHLDLTMALSGTQLAFRYPLR
ncbi:MAG: hypothetical protein M3441_00995 [Chloroflexota bacterium]|nr:hypothetical protein [Chloroflexota bacterium]